MDHSIVIDAEVMRNGLPEIGERLHAQLDELYARPTPDGAEALAANLIGAARAVAYFREAMLAEVAGGE